VVQRLVPQQENCDLASKILAKTISDANSVHLAYTNAYFVIYYVLRIFASVMWTLFWMLISFIIASINLDAKYF
jgi:hypothetical protein